MLARVDRRPPAAGDIIGSGTMGFGAGVEIGRFLQPGDILELELEGVGTLRTPVSVEREKHHGGRRRASTLMKSGNHDDETV
ncbi:fumarylacetoacetate hydrolase family protein [Arthrobacter sp. ISL-30]|nr:fumarylacetoacetate hydrolase family protein [Arthrobacter sp. ISL-30]